ncbi:MAG: right-handed parallel beta-helix repeat-containing protein, partial [Candidatus Eisenbacteria bacterium]|nr:right-handed parallel beta-helix repeat-containing protein [Candidatus Eisenbacteria bacterium]
MKRSVALAALLLAYVGVAHGVIRQVPSQYPTIQAAVDACNPGDIVQVAAGTYSDVTHLPGGPDTTLCAVVMKSGITVQGAGPNLTIVDADSAGRIFHCDGVTNSTIRDLKIRRAFAQAHGCGIFCINGSTPTIVNCDIVENGDGAIICLNSSPTITNCRINDNSSKQGGGLAFEVGSAPSVTDCQILRNQAPVAGGVFVRGGSAAIFTNCDISDNFVNAPLGPGGGLQVVSAQATLNNCQITGNRSGGPGGGLAIYDDASVTLNTCNVSRNRTVAAAPYTHGGGFFIDNSNVTLEDCLITRNKVTSAQSEGAGIYVTDYIDPTHWILNVHQCTIAQNENLANHHGGGGITTEMASPIIQHSIIAGNFVAMHCIDPADDPVVSCSDIFGNYVSNTICGTDGGDNFSLDPKFCNMYLDNYELIPNSPCAPGHHPNGPSACGGQRIGAKDVGSCNLADAGEETWTSGAAARLIGNIPNPSRPATSILFDLPRAASVRLDVFDVSGRLVRRLAEGPFEAGSHAVAWDARDGSGNPAPVSYTHLR